MSGPPQESRRLLYQPCMAQCRLGSPGWDLDERTRTWVDTDVGTDIENKKRVRRRETNTETTTRRGNGKKENGSRLHVKKTGLLYTEARHTTQNRNARHRDEIKTKSRG